MVRYLVLHLLARLLHIRLEGTGQDEDEEEQRKKVEMRSRKKQQRKRLEENEARVEDGGGVAAEGWKRGWEEQEEEKENWPALNGLELGFRLARLENPFIIRLVSPAFQAGFKGGGKLGGSPEAPGGGRGEGDPEDGVATCRSCHRQVIN